MGELSIRDYKNILFFYNKNIPKSKNKIKKMAEDILASKLCRCIKKVDPKNEEKSIGICTRTIINNKGYKRGKFTCKNKPKIKLYKNKNITKKNK